MTRYGFDIETNGLYWEADVVHSLVLIEVDTGEVTSCADQPGYTPISVGLEMLMEADEVIGHNIIAYDIPVLQKIYPGFHIKGRVTDTMILSRVIWPHIFKVDITKRAKGKLDLKNLMGSHGLEAWGKRLGEWKGDYAKTEAEKLKAKYPDKKKAEIDQMVWRYWSKPMQDYCVQDVRVTLKLMAAIEKMNLPDPCWKLEHDFAELITKQWLHGFPFKEAEAAALYADLSKRREELRDELAEQFPPRTIETTFIPKANNSKYGYIKGEPFVKRRIEHFKPSSRDHIAVRLKEMGWEPEEFTKEGKPVVDETTLLSLVDRFPAAEILVEHFLIDKRIGQIAEGNQAWLKLARDGRIHGEVNTNGANTGRCTHSKPNITQVPSVTAPYGEQCRSFFWPGEGMVQLGADASGLELRMLGHFLHKWDKGAFIRELLSGDIHWFNVRALGLTDDDRDDTNPYHKLFRNGAKTFIYGFLYGAGDKKIGEIVRDIILACMQQGLEYKTIQEKFFGKASMNTESGLRKAGKKLKKTFYERMPAIQKLQNAISDKLDRLNNDGKAWTLKGLDGRKLRVRSKHSALNLVLQSAGALVVKLAAVIADRDLTALGFKWGEDYAQMAHAHDEMQYAVRPEVVDEVLEVVELAFRKAGEFFKLNCPIDGEAQKGANWKECH